MQQSLRHSFLILTRVLAAVNHANRFAGGAAFERISLEDARLQNVTFRDCVIRELELTESSSLVGVYFSGCLIGRVVGASNRNGIPRTIVAEDCEIDSYDNISTNSAVQRLDIPPQLIALLTVLRKLYKQAGGGRKIAAFSRGITRQDVKLFIGPVVNVLQRHQFVSIFNSVVHPVRRQAGRVEAILASPALSDDAVVTEVRQIQ